LVANFGVKGCDTGDFGIVARVSTVAFQGVEGLPVEVMVAPGKVVAQIVGLPDKAAA
jgi:magnesium chelatase family protein